MRRNPAVSRGAILMLGILVVLVNSLSIETVVNGDISAAGLKQFNIKRALAVNVDAREETTTANFVRLVVMRLIYGLATTMGAEERLEVLFNGAFVPPNADGDLYALGGFTDYGDDGDDDEISFNEILGGDY